MKKNLILGGASVHLKIIEASKKMGFYTIVTDNIPIEQSEGKRIADEAWNLDIFDVTSIVNKCREEKVDAVIAGWLDPCQKPYFKICEALGLPFYGNAMAFDLMTDKRKFKKICAENGVGIIPEYSFENAIKDKSIYPLFVKPAESRGSRGQCICRSADELKAAFDAAKAVSQNGEAIIEKYMEGAREFQVTYFVVNRKPYLIRTCDSYSGDPQKGLGNIVACSISPSNLTELYLEKEHKSIASLISKLDIENGPVFMQGFEKDGEFHFFDPGLRFPGVDYDYAIEAEYNINLMETMINIAYGIKPNINLENVYKLNGKCVAILFPAVGAGVISNLIDDHIVRSNDKIFSYSRRYSKGDEVKWNYTVAQRLCEIDIIDENKEDIKNAINEIQELVQAYDENGNSLMIDKFDVRRI